MHCIRCGRKISEGKSFCDECAQTVSRPLEESPYLSTHISLPARTARPKKQEAARKTEPSRKPEQLLSALHRAKVAIVVLSLVCALLLGALGADAYFRLRDYFRQPTSGPVVDPDIGTRTSP